MEIAPDFTLTDTQGNEIRLSDFRGKKFVVLTFLRGFTWPHCRKHLAQLRQHYDEFVKRDTEILAIGPDSATAFKLFWATNKMPFVGLADSSHKVSDLYQQQVKLLKFGRMPALMIVDKKGHIVFSHYAENMRDYPTLEEMLEVLDSLRSKHDKRRETVTS